MGIPAKGRDSFLSVLEATSAVPAFAGNSISPRRETGLT